MEYFNHDSSAGGDDKIIALRLECGGAAVDAYWVMLEQIYRDETPLVIFGNQHVLRSVCHRLATDAETLKTWISAMLEIGLFEIDVENHEAIVSRRAIENIKSYKAKAETARQNGKRGGRKPKDKPSGNQRGNQTQTNAETDAKANKNKIKGIDLHKVNQIPNAESAASAASAATLSAPSCPLCETRLYRNPQTGKWECPGCCETYPKDRFAA